jgi:hypothetical protein
MNVGTGTVAVDLYSLAETPKLPPPPHPPVFGLTYEDAIGQPR